MKTLVENIVLSVLFLVFSHSVGAQILIGQTAGFTGPVSAGVNETTAGARIYFDSINSGGGIYGRKIELISLDDKFDPKLAGENARQLIEEKGVIAMFLSRGTPHTQAMIPVLDANRVSLVGPSTGAMALHEPVQKYVFNVRSSYQREAEKAMVYLKTLGLSRIGVVVVNDSFGADALVGAKNGLALAKMQAVVLETFDRVNPDFSTISVNLKAANVQGVLVVGTGPAVVQALGAIRATGSRAQVLTLSNNASSGFIKSLGANAHGVIVTQVFPNERSIGYPIVKEALTLARAQGIKSVSPAMLEGFAAAKVLVEGLRRSGANPGREKLHTALETLRDFDMGGLRLSYSPTSHAGLNFTELSMIGADGQFKR